MNAVETDVDVSVETPGGLERRMTVRVPAAEIEREVDARLAKVGRTAKLKGFRPGKIPPKVVRQRYGTQVREEVVSDVIRSSYSRAIAQEKLVPAGGPRIEPLGGEGETFSYQATFEVYPEVSLGDIGELVIERPEVPIEESDVDAMLEKLREQRGEWQAVDRKSQDGDRVTVDFVGSIDKEPFEGGESRNVPIVVGSGQVLEDFDKALKGVAAGEQKTAKVKFPKDYGSDVLAGKKAVFDITVHKVEALELPEMDDAFFEAFGIKEGGLDALKKELRANMERELAERIRAEAKRNALASLHDANPITVPQALIEREINTLQAEMMRRMGVEDPEKAPPRSRFENDARRRVALVLLIQELIRERNIEVDRERVERRIEELAAPYEKPQEAARAYRSSREMMAQIESGVLEDQVVDYLLEHAKTKQKKVSFQAFMDAS